MKSVETQLAVLIELCIKCNDIAVEKGFWSSNQYNLTPVKLSLMHSELSEALEADRQTGATLSSVYEELADCVIRIFDFAGFYSPTIFSQILLDKIETNKGREEKHGKLY